MELLPLTTERLILRPFEASDGEALYAYYSRPEVARFLLDEPWTKPQVAEQMHKRLQRRSLNEQEGRLALACEYQAQVVGDVSLWLTDDTRQVAEIGWVLNPDFSGQGLATEAVMAVLTLAFEAYGLRRVAAQMDARNLASAKLCGRLGMRHEAYLRQNWWSKGEWTDTLIYAVLASDRPR